LPRKVCARTGFGRRFGLRNVDVAHPGNDFPNGDRHHLPVGLNEPIDSGERLHGTYPIFI
jgi:hypothetical protein